MSDIISSPDIPIEYPFQCLPQSAFNCQQEKGQNEMKIEIQLLFQFFISFGKFAAKRRGNEGMKETTQAALSMNYRLEYRNISSTISLNKQHPLSLFSRVPKPVISEKYSELPRSLQTNIIERKKSGKWQSNETDIKLIYTRFCIFSFIHSRILGGSSRGKIFSNEYRMRERRILITFS